MRHYYLYPAEGRRDQFIDFLKGIAIIGIVWLHCMPLQSKMLAPLWCGMSVTLFLMVQVFHAYHKGASKAALPNMRKLTMRIILPMLVVTGILAIIQWKFGIVLNAGGVMKNLKSGGFGPGCYYPWVYLQFAVAIALFGRLQKFLKPTVWGGVTLVFSIVIDSLSAFVEMPEWLWRILFFRYTLLIWLGYDVLANGIRISPKLLLLAMISIAFILKMYYGNSDLSPWLIHNGWKVEHWPAYFYPAYLLLWIIRSLYEITPSMIRRLVSRFGMASYEIFLLQMFFFSIFKPAHVDLFQNEVFNFLLFLMIAWSFSLGGGLYWNTLKEKKLIK